MDGPVAPPSAEAFGLRSIPRVGVAEAGVRLAAHRRAQVPLIIEGLVPRERIDPFARGDALERALDGHDVLLVRNFYDQDISEERSVPVPWPGADYLQALRDQQHGGHYVALTSAPPALASAFEPAAAALVPTCPVERRLFFLADEGYQAPMHIDGDFRETIFMQLCGRKRWALVEPERSPEMLPYRNYSTIAFHRLGPQTRRRLLQQRNAWTAELAPGDSMYVPRSLWHCVENSGISAAVAFRFGQTAVARLLWLIPGHYATHVLYAAMVRGGLDEAEQRRVALEVLAVYLAEHDSPWSRRAATLEAIDTQRLELEPTLELEPLQGDHFSVAERKDRYRVRKVPYYWTPEVCPRMEPHAPATAAQRQRIESLAAAAGVEASALATWCGRLAAPRALTQLEAQVVILHAQGIRGL